MPPPKHIPPLVSIIMEFPHFPFQPLQLSISFSYYPPFLFRPMIVLEVVAGWLFIASKRKSGKDLVVNLGFVQTYFVECKVSLEIELEVKRD